MVAVKLLKLLIFPPQCGQFFPPAVRLRFQDKTQAKPTAKLGQAKSTRNQPRTHNARHPHLSAVAGHLQGLKPSLQGPNETYQPSQAKKHVAQTRMRVKHPSERNMEN